MTDARIISVLLLVAGFVFMPGGNPLRRALAAISFGMSAVLFLTGHL